MSAALLSPSRAARPAPSQPTDQPARPDGTRQQESKAMRGPNATSRLHQEALQFRVILAATYPLFLAAAISQRLLPGRGARPALGDRRSVFGEAKAMAVSAIPFAFMG